MTNLGCLQRQKGFLCNFQDGAWSRILIGEDPAAAAAAAAVPSILLTEDDGGNNWISILTFLLPVNAPKNEPYVHAHMVASFW